MRAEQLQPDIAGQLRSLSGADIFARPSSAVLRGALRLEAGFYGSEGYRALHAMEKSGFKIGQIGDLAEVTWFGPFSRTYVDDHAFGVPFLSSSDMMAANLVPKNFLSSALTRNLKRLLVKKGTILVSCSGTIGNVAICTKDFNGHAVSQHAIRVDTKTDIDRGVLYAFLLSELGQFLITRNKSGSVIESIYATDVAGLPLPLLPKDLRCDLSNKIQRACDLRVSANALLDEANRLVLNLVNSHDIEHKAERPWFIQSAHQIFNARETEGYARLDATYYKPVTLNLRARIRASRGVALKDRVQNVILIGKTFVEGVHKVERGYGVPYFTGKELFTYRLLPGAYITSHRPALIDKLIVTRGTTLITCAGTVGKVMYVRGSLEGAAITHDAIRVLPGDEIHPGFVYAFLASSVGQSQLQRCSYGSVIPRLYRTHVENILVPETDDGGIEIGTLVDQAFDLRAQAMTEEGLAIKLFVDILHAGRIHTEKQWSREY